MRLVASWMITVALLWQGPPAAGTAIDQPQSVRTVLDAVIADGTAKSAIGLVAKDHEIVFLDAVGDFGDGTPLTTDAIVRLASLTKPITATAIMMLVESGALRLTDRVDRWFPRFGDRVAEGATTVPAQRNVTIRDLLTHQAGVASDGEAFFGLFEAPTAQEFAAGLGRLPLRFQPGARFEYGCCGASYEVLGAIVERVSNQPLKDFLAEKIFAPLKMHDTFFSVPASKRSRLAAQYGRNPAGMLVAFRTRGQEEPDNNFYSGAGGLRSSILDYHRFARFLLNDGALDGVRLLRPESVRQMTTNQVGAAYPEADLGWGMGAEVRTNATSASLQQAGAFGWGGGTGTQFVVDPSLKLIAIVFVPTSPGTPGVTAAKRAFLEAAYGAGQTY